MSGDRIVSNRETLYNRKQSTRAANAKAITVLVGASVLGVILTLQGLVKSKMNGGFLLPSSLLFESLYDEPNGSNSYIKSSAL